MISGSNQTVSERFVHSAITSSINAAAIAVHKALGPGFLESIYEEALCVELKRRQIAYQRQVGVSVRYDGVPVGLYRLDLVIESKIIVEVKAVSTISAIHMATVFAYLKSTNAAVGLIINFGVDVVRIKRIFRGSHGVNE